MYGAPVGTIRLTTSSQIIPTTYKGRIFNVHLIASGTSTTVKFLDNGSGGTLKLQEQSTSSNPKTVDYGVNGYLFDNGIYVLVDAQTSQVTIQYRQEEYNSNA